MSTVEYLNPAGQPAPVGQYTNVAIVPSGARTAHVAGQLPVDDEGRVVGDDFAAQADLVFGRLAETLEAVGSSLANVVFMRAYLVRDSDFAAFRDVRRRAYERFGVSSPPPATTIVVRGLYGGASVELDAVAVLE
jgi:2-iminobutanoate/2-iminopropanoate deaminase